MLQSMETSVTELFAVYYLAFIGLQTTATDISSHIVTEKQVIRVCHSSLLAA